jgi:uncharacterized glyoxalase superfamily protein PhnB
VSRWLGPIEPEHHARSKRSVPETVEGLADVAAEAAQSARCGSKTIAGSSDRAAGCVARRSGRTTDRIAGGSPETTASAETTAAAETTVSAEATASTEAAAPAETLSDRVRHRGRQCHNHQSDYSNLSRLRKNKHFTPRKRFVPRKLCFDAVPPILRRAQDGTAFSRRSTLTGTAHSRFRPGGTAQCTRWTSGQFDIDLAHFDWITTRACLVIVVRTNANSSRAGLVPAMRYRDVAAAIDWISTAFGFSKHRIVTGDDGAILYGLLTFGDHMIMVWPVRESDLDRLMRQPDEIGGAETQTCYLVVEDADTHYSAAKAAGADIVIDIKDHDDLGRGYSCRDPEGHIWHFGTYDPWQNRPISVRPSFSRRNNFPSMMLFGGFFIATIAVAGTGWMLGHARQGEQESGGAAEAIAAASQRADELARRLELLTAERTQAGIGKDVAERAAQAAREQLERERTAKEAAERQAQRLEEQLAQQGRAKDLAESAAMETALGAIEEAKLELRSEREARQRVERTLQDMLSQLALENGAKEKEASERVAREARERLADMQSESKSSAERARLDKSSKEIPKEAMERRSSASADLNGAMRTRRICGNILSEPAGYDEALVELCQKASRR